MTKKSRRKRQQNKNQVVDEDDGDLPPEEPTQEENGDSSHERDEVTIMQAPPPRAVWVVLMSYLDANDLLAISQLSTKWRQFCAKNAELNFFWWNYCMNAWYEKSSRPTKMSTQDKKKDWKAAALSVGGPPGPRRELVLQKEKDPDKKHDHSFWDTGPTTKEQWRAHYKGIRSKPKNKVVRRDVVEKSDWFQWSEG